MRHGAIAIGFLVLLSCRSAPGPAVSGEAKRIEIIFLPADHVLADCARGLEKSLADLPDGVLFLDSDSRISVKTPGDGWHAHLMHRVSGLLVDTPIEGKEALSIDCSRYAAPERLIVTSAAHRAGKPRDQAILPSFALAWRLISRGQAAEIGMRQPFRYEMRMPAGIPGTVDVFRQPLNSADMLVSIVDPQRKFDRLLEDSYLVDVAADAYLVPRVVVETATAEGRVWQRSGAWPRPPGGGTAVAWRTPRRELLRFEAPPRIDLSVATERPEVDAVIEAGSAGDPVGVVLGVALSEDLGGQHRYRVQTHELDGRGRYTVDLSHVDAGRFPVTAAVVHRVVQPWVVEGGAWIPKAPLGVSVPGGGEEPRLHARVVVPMAASHYSLVRFAGYGAKGRAGDSVAWMAMLPVPGAPGAGPGIVPSLTGATGVVAGPLAGAGMPGTALTSGTSGSATTGTTSAGIGPFMPEAVATAAPLPGGLGDSGDNDDPVPPTVKTQPLDFTLICPGCVFDKECRCHPHSLLERDIMDPLRSRFRYITDTSRGISYEIADYAWFRAHYRTVPCHKRTFVGTVRMSWWVGAQLCSARWHVLVTFGPCHKQEKGDVDGGSGLGGGVGGSGPRGPGGGDSGLERALWFADERGDSNHPFNTPSFASGVGRRPVSATTPTCSVLLTETLRRNPAVSGSAEAAKAYWSRMEGARWDFRDPESDPLSRELPVVAPPAIEPLNPVLTPPAIDPPHPVDPPQIQPPQIQPPQIDPPNSHNPNPGYPPKGQ